MLEPLHIHLVSDGRKGHENQSLGLAEALARLTPAEIHLHSIDPDRSFLSNRRQLRSQANPLPAPDLILCAGHHTHLPALTLKWQKKWHGRPVHDPQTCQGRPVPAPRKNRPPLVVLMKPSLPLALFDLALIPRHDLEKRGSHPKIVPTTGALNRIIPHPDSPKTHRLILLGGPSKTHGWDPEPLRKTLRELSTRPGLPWHLADSRRTPAGFLDTLADLPFEIFPHQETDSNWLPHQLTTAAEIHVTEDSVSMIYEALTAGPPVHLLPLPRKRDNRLTRALDQLHCVAGEMPDGCFQPADHHSRRLEACSTSPHQPAAPHSRRLEACSTSPPPLAEAERCARLLLEKLFPEKSS